MPLRDFSCASCGLQQERFYHVNQAPPPCAHCEGQLQVLERSNEGDRRKSAVFPFVTTHIDGKGRPIEVTDMGHLRRLEREYGVVLSEFSNNNSVDHVGDKHELPVYRGHLSERERKSGETVFNNDPRLLRRFGR